MKAAIQIIREADRGQLLADLQEGVDEIVSAIEEARGAGTGEIIIKLKITSPSEGAYAIASVLNIKIPTRKRLDTMMFLSSDGELQRHDPKQPTLPSVVDADEVNRRRSGVIDQ